MRLANRILPVTSRLQDQRFVFGEDGRLVATPLMAALINHHRDQRSNLRDRLGAGDAAYHPEHVHRLLVEVISDPDLRALYFFLAEIVQRFRFLSYAIAGILAWVGVTFAALRPASLAPGRREAWISWLPALHCPT